MSSSFFYYHGDLNNVDMSSNLTLIIWLISFYLDTDYWKMNIDMQQKYIFQF